jgi:hypothetical protein
MNASKEHERAANRARRENRKGMKDEELEPLVRGTIEGDRRAKDGLLRALEPRIERIAGRWRVTSHLSRSRDDRRNIVVLVLERLVANGCKRLRLLHEVLLRGEGAGWPWIEAMVRNTALNYTEAHREHLGAGVREDGSYWAAILSFDDEIGERLPAPARLLTAIEARRIYAYAERALPPRQFRALCLWLTGHDDREIARELGLAGAGAAARLVHTAIMRLRRRFAPGAGAEKKSSGQRDEMAPEPVHGQMKVARSAGGSRRREAARS